MKLLVVEDDVKIATSVKRGLEAEGFTVDLACDGPEGLWMATEGTYDLIVLDILLPGRNGYQVCADLRNDGNWTPILMLTAKDGDLDEAEALDAGADDYLTKPFSFPVLVARVRARCAGHRAAAQPLCRLATYASNRPNGAYGAATKRSGSRRGSSRCSSFWCVALAKCCPRLRSSAECGSTISKATPTSSRCTSAAVGLASTSPTDGGPSRP